MSPVRVFAVLLTLCFAAPVIAAGKPIKNKTKHVEVANLNILHGFACDPLSPDDGDQCRVVERMDRLIEEIAAAGCPDIVTLQENVTDSFVLRNIGEQVGPLEDTTALIRERLPLLGAICGFEYGVVFDPLAERPPQPRILATTGGVRCIRSISCVAMKKLLSRDCHWESLNTRIRTR